jgi:hypothetical protein
MASMAACMLPKAVITTTGVSGRLAAIFAHSSMPLLPPRLMSVTTTSNSSVSSNRKASSAEVRAQPE